MEKSTKDKINELKKALKEEKAAAKLESIKSIAPKLKETSDKNFELWRQKLSEEEVIISREKATDFKKWMGK